jgi:hypothetical protein
VTLIFDATCRLTRVDDSCFTHISLEWRRVLRSVQHVRKGCFLRDRLRDLRFGPELRLSRIEEPSFQYWSLKAICAPKSVEILSQLGFAYANVHGMTFQDGPRLKRIEELCCSVKCFRLPKDLDYRSFHSNAASAALSVLLPNRSDHSIEEAFMITVHLIVCSGFVSM